MAINQFRKRIFYKIKKNQKRTQVGFSSKEVKLLIKRIPQLKYKDLTGLQFTHFIRKQLGLKRNKPELLKRR